MAIRIISSCSIENGHVVVNGETVFSLENGDFSEFLKAAFKELDTPYSKFYKMDKLCQLAFLGSEYLLKEAKLTFSDDEVALVFFNGQSSLDTDSKHQQLIQEGSKVSPAVFVYTLPNIMIGEIAIRNKWYGENLLILKPSFDFEEWAMEADLLISRKKATYCLGGWIDVFQENYQMQLYLVEASGLKISILSI